MSAIFYKNLPYGAGGSNVEANPSGSAADDLEKIGIDGTVYDVTDADAVHNADKGVANGVASLDATGRVPSTQLPSYVDDVLEYASQSAFPATGESGKIYIALDTNKTYRWSGSAYVEISESLALGTTHSTAAYGDDAVSTAEPSFSEASTRANLAGSGEKLSVILGKIKKWFTDLKDLAFIGKDGNNSKKYLRGDGTWQSIFEGSVVGDIQIKDNDSEFTTTIYAVNDSLTGLNLINVPDKSGTMAVTSDIPDVETAKTATGNPITLTDASESYAEELEVTLEPIQDLHGYANPWVGGAGKNKLPITVAGIKANNTGSAYSWSGNVCTVYNVTLTILTDSVGNVTGIKVNGTASNNVNFYITINEPFNGNYKLNGCSGGGSTTYRLYVYTANYSTEYSCYDGDVSMTLPSDNYRTTIFIRSGTTISNKVFYPMIRLATENDPTFAPYTNICPITGYTECEVDVVGKNWADLAYPACNIASDSTIQSNGSYNVYVAKMIGGETYFPSTGQSGAEGFVYALFKDYPQLNTASYDGVRYITSPQAFIAPFDGYIAFRSASSFTQGQFELGSTATPYEPYDTTTATISFGQTVYGCDVDMLTGKVDVNKGYKDLGSLTYSSAGTNLFEAAISDMGNSYSYSSNLSEFASDSYHAKYDWAGWNSMSHGEFGCNGNNVRLKNTDYSDATAFKTAMSGRQFVYPLATPITLQLTPAELKLLKKQNTITTNGTTISLKYQPDNVIGEAISVSEEYTDRHFAWKKVGEYNDGETITINGTWNEIMICAFQAQMGGGGELRNSVIYPFDFWGKYYLETPIAGNYLYITSNRVVNFPVGVAVNSVFVYVR